MHQKTDKSFTKTGKTVYFFLLIVGTIIAFDGAIEHGIIRLVIGLGFLIAAGIFYAIASIQYVGWHGMTFSKT